MKPIDLDSPLGFSTDSPNKILKDNNVEIFLDSDLFAGYYGLSWKHGVMGAIMPAKYGEDAAKLTAALFVVLWKNCVECSLAEELAYAYTYTYHLQG